MSGTPRINDVRRRKEKILDTAAATKSSTSYTELRIVEFAVTKEIPNVPPILFDNREIIAIGVTNKGNEYVYPKLNYQFGEDDIQG